MNILLKKLEKEISMNKAILNHKANAIHFHDDRYVKLDTVYTKEEIKIMLSLLKSPKVEKTEHAVDLSPVYSELKELSVKLHEKIAIYDNKLNQIEGILESLKPKTEE